MNVCGYCGSAVRSNIFGNAVAHDEGHLGRSPDNDDEMCPGHGLPMVEATGGRVRFSALAISEAFIWDFFPDVIFVKARREAATMFRLGADAAGRPVRRLQGTTSIANVMVRRATADDWPYE